MQLRMDIVYPKNDSGKPATYNRVAAPASSLIGETNCGPLLLMLPTAFSTGQIFMAWSGQGLSIAVRTLIGHVPKERRALATWRHVEKYLAIAAAGGDVRDAAIALRLVLMMECVPCHSL
jgi:hypothetical protein